jgi:hypothetical protein
MLLGKHMMHVQVLTVFELLVTDWAETLLPVGELPRAVRQVLSDFAPNWLIGVGCETVAPSRGE